MADSSLEFLHEKTEHTFVKLSLGVIAGLVLLVVLGWGGHRLYVRWQEDRLMKQAHAALAKNDLRWAALAAQRAYDLNANNVDASRTLASIAEKQHAPETLDWYRRVIALAPDSMSDRLALIESALRAGQPEIAQEALKSAPADQQKTAAFQAAAAHVALAKNDLAAAGERLEAASRLAPNDPKYQLELAEFQLRSDDRAQRDAGRALAMKLKENPKVRLDVLHVLLNDAIRWRYDDSAVSLAKELEATQGVTMTDRLLSLGILHGFQDPASSGVLTRLEALSAKSAESAVQLVTWMNTHGLSLLALDWAKTLSPEIRASIPLRFALADSYLRLHDWSGLRLMLQQGSWERGEPVRLAFLAKVASETGDDIGAEKQWAAAVNQTENDPARLNLLQNLAFQWNWPDKATAILWLLVENPETQVEALQALYRYYSKQGDTTGLYRTLTRLITVVPRDPAVQNNFAQISLLLRAETLRAIGIARELHLAHPDNAAYASTYAFGLFQSDDLPGALKVMQKLSPKQLHDPATAAYYGVFLAAAGKVDAAKEYLALADQAGLLPEEKNLVDRAKASLAWR